MMTGTPNQSSTSNSSLIPIYLPPCKWILIEDIGESNVRIWDTIILIPNLLFLLFLLLKLRSAVAKLATTSSPIFLAFYGLVFLVSVISVLRCVVSMTVNASMTAGDIADKILWLILRFFLLATEMSVIVFGLAFGHLDSRTSIRRVLAVTFALSLIYSGIQGVLEFVTPDPRFRVKTHASSDDFELFGHGGMIFWFISSTLLSIVYMIIFVMPYTALRQRLSLPTKRSFYVYCLLLSCLNAAQAIGSILLYNRVEHCMCVVNITTYLYFSFYDPLVYGTFLREFFRSSSSSILYSYKPQHDDVTDEDAVIMPYQSSPFAQHDTSYLSNSYNSTHFDQTINGETTVTINHVSRADFDDDLADVTSNSNNSTGQLILSGDAFSDVSDMFDDGVNVVPSEATNTVDIIL